MKWYWNMTDRQAALFFGGQFIAVAFVTYLVLGLAWGWWSNPVDVFVPLWAGIASNLLWTFHNLASMP